MATKQASRSRVTMTVTDPSTEQAEQAEQVTPEPSPAETLAAEAAEHAAFLTKVRNETYTRARSWGICSSGRNAYLRDVGIPFNDTSRYGDSDSQPAITVDPFNGNDPAWFTPDGLAGLIERQRDAYRKQRGKIARGILRANKQGYGSSGELAEVMAELGLDTPPVTLTAEIRLGDYSNVTVAGITPGTTSEQVSAAFREMVARNLGLYLPGWQAVKVTAGFDVVGLTEEYATDDDDDDKWTF